MQNVLTGSNPRLRHGSSRTPNRQAFKPAAFFEAIEPIGELPTTSGFTSLLVAYRATGGTARGEDVARLLEERGVGDFIGLARLIAAGDVFGFEWRSTLWIPMFQFDLHNLSVRRSVRLILAELGNGFDGWARAAWFAAPNSWLQQRKPADLMSSELTDVLSAARADRFIAVG